MNIQLLVVDPQNDFVIKDSGSKIKDGLIKHLSKSEAEAIVDPFSNKGSLVVDGAEADMSRLAAFINRVGSKLDDIHVTMDSHQSVGIERNTWWKNAKTGIAPAPFTVLGLNAKNSIVEMRFDNGSFVPTDVEITTVKPSRYNRSRDYLKALAAGGKFPHVIWPVHCVVGTWGWSVVPEVSDALCKWEREQSMRVNYVVKGNNPWTEHFGGLMAEVPDPKDPTTQINTGLVQTLETADLIPISGEALSHCVNCTIRQVAAAFSDPVYIKKLVLLTDTSSNVGGFEFLGKAFIDDMTRLGMQTSTTVDFLA